MPIGVGARTVGVTAVARDGAGRESQPVELPLIVVDDLAVPSVAIQVDPSGGTVGAGSELVAVAVGEVVAGTARLGDILVAAPLRGTGIGGDLIELFCRRAVEAGAARCYLRCPDTPRHRRFYERHGFVPLARLPRYYHDKDFLEYLREPLAVAGGPARRRPWHRSGPDRPGGPHA